jgi:hypothetical protein
MKLSLTSYCIKAVNVNFIADVAVKTKGKLNAAAPATSEYLLMFLQSLPESTSTGAGNGAGMPLGFWMVC